MFCFADTYFVETRKAGKFHLIKVEKSSQGEPFKLTLQDKGNTDKHGTKIYTESQRKASDMTSEQISELIRSRFVADPEFNIQVNQVADAKKVLDELHYRLALIKKLDSLIENHTADELHDLQPLFERGLWIFGPEFESISFTSNRSLSTVVKRFFGEALARGTSQSAT